MSPQHGAPGPASDAGVQLGLPFTVVNRLLLGALVAALFVQRFELDWYRGGAVSVPSIVFVSVVLLLAAKMYADACLGLARFRGFTRAEAVIALFLLASAGSLVGARFALGEVAGLSQFSKTFSHLLFVVGAAVLLSRAVNVQSLRWMLKLYVTFCVIGALFGLVQFVDQNLLSNGITGALNLSSMYSFGLHRPASIFWEPAFFSYVMLDAVAISLLIGHRTGQRGYLLAAAICAPAAVATLSLGGIAVLVLLLGLLLRWRYLRPVVVAAAAIGVVATFAIIGSSHPIAEGFQGRTSQLFERSESSLVSRMDINQATLEIWKDAPVTGVGLGNVRFHLLEKLTLLRLIEKELQFSAANAYLSVLAETGVIGLGALLVLFWYLLRGQRGSPGGDSASIQVCEGVTWTLLVLTVAELLVIGAFFWPRVWFVIGLRLFVITERSRSRAQAPQPGPASIARAREGAVVTHDA